MPYSAHRPPYGHYNKKTATSRDAKAVKVVSEKHQYTPCQHRIPPLSAVSTGKTGRMGELAGTWTAVEPVADDRYGPNRLSTPPTLCSEA